MANSIIRWCKTKLLNGYKHVESGCRSDTETLVRGSEEDFMMAAPLSTVGSVINPDSPLTAGRNFWKEKETSGQRGPRHHSNTAAYLEEVTCDVSLSSSVVDGGIDNKQEFAFTLYDFDGHGKITKDDIASLVQTIYETVGSSLSLPPSGSRTIRVKLTVAPEAPGEPPPSFRKMSKHPSKESPRSFQEEPSSPIYSPRALDEVEVASSPGRSPLRGDDSVPFSPLHRGSKGRRGRRKNSLRRQELLQIIQANMEKNNLFYPPFGHHPPHQHRRRKRYHCSCFNNASHQLHDETQKWRSCICKGGCHCSCECQQNKCHYRSRSHDFETDSPHAFRHSLLDSTSCGNGANPSQAPLPPSNTPDRPPTSPKSVHHHHHNHVLPHQRSRSCGSSDDDRRNGWLEQTDGGSLQAGEEGRIKHPKHVDHSRAMTQVVTWMQKSSFRECHRQRLKGNGSSVNNSTCGRSHHVHQHYHHHYHHYPSTPPLII